MGVLALNAESRGAVARGFFVVLSFLLGPLVHSVTALAETTLGTFAVNGHGGITAVTARL